MERKQGRRISRRRSRRKRRRIRLINLFPSSLYLTPEEADGWERGRESDTQSKKRIEAKAERGGGR